MATGTSAIARNEVNEAIANIRGRADDVALELHNLYGQVLSETGFIGTFFFLLIISIYLYQLYSIKHIKKIDLENLKVINNYKLLLQSYILLMLFMVSLVIHFIVIIGFYYLHVMALFIDIVTHNYKDRDANS